MIELVSDPSVERLDLVQLFGRTAPLHVDLGCADGSFVCELAQQLPHKNFLGIERLTKRVEKARRRAEGIENVSVLQAESAYAVRYLLPKHSVETFYLSFPDPWPKRRHQRRRIFTRDFLDSIADALEPGGVLRVTTDQREYFDQMGRIKGAYNQFEIGPDNDVVLPLTNFERKFLEKGAAVYRLTLRKISPVK